MKHFIHAMMLGGLLIAGCRTDERPPVYPVGVPSVDSDPGPLQDGTGRVVIDSNPRARLTLVLADGVSYSGTQVAVSTATRLLCDTPCVVDLPLGLHKIMARPKTFEADIDEPYRSFTVEVKRRPAVYKLAFARRTGPSHALGGTILLLGGGLATFGYIAHNSSDGNKVVPIGMVLAGLAGVVWGTKTVLEHDMLEKAGAYRYEPDNGQVYNIVGDPLPAAPPDSRAKPGAATDRPKTKK